MSEPSGKHGLLAGIGEKLIHALPPHFLVLVLINAMFLGILFWFVDARARHTAAVLNQLLTACLNKGG
jgi:hypothetical protein